MSEKRQAALALTAERLGILSVNSFGDRLVLQKSIYLLQEVIGLDLGYRYSWYIRGPYCSAVAHDAYNATRGQTLKAVQERFTLSKEALDFVNRFQERILQTQPKSIDRATWLEVLSSLHYLMSDDPFSAPVSQEEAVEKLLEMKPFLRGLNASVFQEAWTILSDEAQ